MTQNVISLISLLVALLLFTPSTASSIEELRTSISNPTAMDVCTQRDVIIIASDQKVEIFTKTQQQFKQETILIQATWVKCLRKGFIAMANKTTICIYDSATPLTPIKCKNHNNILSIAEQIETNQTFLLVFSNNSMMELSEIQIQNYANFSKPNQIIAAQSTISKATYVSNHQYIYTSNELNSLQIYEYPFRVDSAPIKTIKIEDVFPIDSIKTLRNLNAALLSNKNGDFALIKDNEFISSWTKTPYTKGTLCTKERFALANSKKIAVFEYDQVKFHEGFKINGELQEIICLNDEQQERFYLLDSSGKIIIVQDNNSRGIGLYILIAILLVIAAAAIKFIWFPSKSSQNSTDMDDASKQDREHAYQQLKDMNVKDFIKEDK